MIELKKVTKQFEKTTILDEISMQIPKGSIFGLIGSNGAGKSTLLRLLCGVYETDGGEVLLDGKQIFDHADVKKRVFFVSDETVQYQKFTVKSLAKFYAQYYPNFSYDLLNKMLKSIQLPDNKQLNSFSKGMKRQAITMIGIAAQPDYLLLDEAFDGLDPAMRVLMRRMIVDLMLEKQMTVVISSHNLSEINEICDSAALLHDKKIVFCKQLDDLRASIHKVQVAFKQGTEPKTEADFKELGIDMLSIKQQQSVYHLVVRGEEDAIREKITSMNPLLVDIIPLTLEEIFIHELEVLGYGSYVFEENDVAVSE